VRIARGHSVHKRGAGLESSKISVVELFQSGFVVNADAAVAANGDGLDSFCPHHGAQTAPRGGTTSVVDNARYQRESLTGGTYGRDLYLVVVELATYRRFGVFRAQTGEMCGVLDLAAVLAHDHVDELRRLASQEDAVVTGAFKCGREISPRVGVAPHTCQWRFADNHVPSAVECPCIGQQTRDKPEHVLRTKRIGARRLVVPENLGAQTKTAQIVPINSFRQLTCVGSPVCEVHPQDLAVITVCHGFNSRDSGFPSQQKAPEHPFLY